MPLQCGFLKWGIFPSPTPPFPFRSLHTTNKEKPCGSLKANMFYQAQEFVDCSPFLQMLVATAEAGCSCTTSDDDNEIVSSFPVPYLDETLKCSSIFQQNKDLNLYAFVVHEAISIMSSLFLCPQITILIKNQLFDLAVPQLSCVFRRPLLYCLPQVIAHLTLLLLKNDYISQHPLAELCLHSRYYITRNC